MDNILDLFMYTDIWALIFARIVATIVMLPIILETKIPATATAVFSMILSLVVFFTIPVEELVYQKTLLGFGLTMMKEVIVGIIIGFSIMIFFQVYLWMGQMLSTQGGLAMSSIYDPSSNTQTPILGRFFALSFGVLFTITGGYHWFLAAFIETFRYIPVGQSVFNPGMAMTVIDALTIFFELGFRLATPILGIVLMIDVGLGVLARAAPQMNMFVIGVPLKLLVILFLMTILIEIFPGYNNMVIEHMKDNFYNMLEGLMYDY
ncbi:MAG: flagellar biosynthetic protein FliR [Epulopiscium sp. Nuni2H_MBin003]|nr:MAG: flagellar biosynthetic protein FliR [Epulopiscium sp. Nuni2H_MBin003]